MRTLVYTTAVNTEGRATKDIDIFGITRKSWEHYCKHHNIDFYVIDQSLYPNTSPHWFRYWIFDLKPDYDRYLYIDTDIMVRWDAPNIFEEYESGKIYAVRDNSGLSWIYEGIKAYQSMFPDTVLDWERYFNSGVLLFDHAHKNIIDSFKQLYIDNQDIILEYREKYRKGFDQTIFNYYLCWAEQSVDLISERWNLFHMTRKEVLHNGYFIDLAYFWHFNGLDRGMQPTILKNIWNQIKDRYEN